MKKTLSIILFCMLLFSLCSCKFEGTEAFRLDGHPKDDGDISAYLLLGEHITLKTGESKKINPIVYKTENTADFNAGKLTYTLSGDGVIAVTSYEGDFANFKFSFIVEGLTAGEVYLSATITFPNGSSSTDSCLITVY